MKGKLIKTDVNYLLEDDKGVVVASTSTKEGINGLSKQNCDEIFGVVDVVYKQVRNGFDGVIDSFTEAFAKECINKAMELNKDKLFTLEDMKRAIDKAKQGSVKETHNGYGRPTERRFDLDDLSYDEIIQSIQQPTEIEVEIEMECLDPNCDGINKKGVCIPGDKPKLDENGCLILKKL
jgi:hypothetical protein